MEKNADELKSELQSVVDEDDFALEDTDRAMQTLRSLEGLRLSSEKDAQAGDEDQAQLSGNALAGDKSEDQAQPPEFRSPLSGELQSAVQDLPCSIKKDALAGFPPEFRCPLSGVLMNDPVVIATGQTYERGAIRRWIENGHQRCPRTNRILTNNVLIPNLLAKEIIMKWRRDAIAQSNSSRRDVGSVDGNVLSAEAADKASDEKKILMSVDGNVLSAEAAEEASDEKQILMSVDGNVQSAEAADEASDEKQILMSVDGNVLSAEAADEASDEKKILMSVDGKVLSAEAADEASDEKKILMSVDGKVLSAEAADEASDEKKILMTVDGNVLSAEAADEASDEKKILMSVGNVLSAEAADEASDEKQILVNLLRRISSPKRQEHNMVAKEIRKWTKSSAKIRSLFGELPHAIPLMIHILSSTTDADVEEDLITTLLNISIVASNKKQIAEIPGAIPVIIKSLRSEKAQTRSNAAGALFTIADLESNKRAIGDLGALKPLIELVDEGHDLVMKDAAAAIFKICKLPDNRSKAVADGVVQVLIKKMRDEILVAELLAILTLICSQGDGVEEMVEDDAVPLLLRIMRDDASQKNKENAVLSITSICAIDKEQLRKVDKEENKHETLYQLTLSGSKRAKRKASALLKRLKG